MLAVEDIDLVNFAMETTSEVDTMLKDFASIELIQKTQKTSVTCSNCSNREASAELRKKTSKSMKAESELAISVHLN